MAIQQTQTLPAPFLEDITKNYATRLGAVTAPALDTSKFAPKIAAQDPYETDAYTRTQQGLGAYQPYITSAGAYSGPSAYQSFMSPYQTDVINKTLAEYDTQAAKGLSGIGLLAAQSGNLGGGREGVMRSEYQSKSDMNRALLNAQLLQQGFGQAQTAADRAYGQQMQLAGQVPALYGQDTAALGQMGALQRSYEQAGLGATQEAERMKAYEPYERLGYLGTGITGMLGGYPGQYQSTIMPNPTPLQSALGIGSTLAGIYGDWKQGQGWNQWMQNQ